MSRRHSKPDEKPPPRRAARAGSSRALGDALPAGVFAADAAGRVLYVNPRLEALSGLPAATIVADGLLAALHPDDRARVEREWAATVAEPREWQSELRCRHADGVVVTLAVRSVPLHQRGAVSGHLAVVENVSFRARIQAKLSTLIDASRMLLQSPRLDAVLPATVAMARDLIAADGYAVWRLRTGEDWRIVGSDGISETFAGAIIETHQGAAARPMGFTTPMAVEDVHALPLLAERRAAYAAEGIHSMLVAPLHIGGEWSGSLAFYYRAPQHFDRIRIETAGALGNLAAVAISTAELYEEQLRQRQRLERAHQQATFLAEAGLALGSSLDYEATLRTVADLAVPRFADWCAVDILDADGRLKRLAVAHVDPAKIELARTFADRYPERPDSQHGVRHVIRSGQPVLVPQISDALLVAAAQDAEHLAALRELKLAAYVAVPLIANGRTLGAISFVSAESGRAYDREDVLVAQAVAERAALAVESARAYREAQAANRAKDEFLATLSHELRTPINAIMGWGQILQHGAIDADRKAHAVDAIVRNAAAQGRLIEDLLDLSRIVSGKLRLDVELLDIGAVVAAAVATVEPAAQAKGLRVQTVIDEGGGRIYGDRQRLQQAIWNLLANAVKFTPRGGRVQIHVLRVNSHVEVVVADTGEGIRPEVLPFVFERFRQADSSSTRSHTGLGLGLAIVRHIVELHGGTVHAASDGANTGATFRLHLPLSVVKPAGPADAVPVTHPAVPAITTGTLNVETLPDLTGTRVLVVEDDPDAREMVAYLLRQRHAEVITVASVDEALAAIDLAVPDVLLSDVEMPRRDGYALIAAVRSRSPEHGGLLPAAALTAYSRPEDRARSMLAGYDAHLSKPVDLAELVATVMRLRSRNG